MDLRDESHIAPHTGEDADPQTEHSTPKAVVEVKEEQGTSDSASEPIMDEVEKNKKRHLNVVFIGHVDDGRSTIGGQILYLSGQVDEQTIQKYKKEAKDMNRDSWYIAYIMDTNAEEREKGITVEVGRAHFETETTRFTILDAPGHKSYVPNMISGAYQADIGVLVISARKGEFETGYVRGGQTREHVQLAKTLGVSKLLVVVNKMDHPTINWSKKRYDEILSKMVPFLKSCGYNVKKDVQFLPISGLHGTNMKTRMDKKVCPWWSGQCLFEALDAIEVPPRDPNDAEHEQLRMLLVRHRPAGFARWSAGEQAIWDRNIQEYEANRLWREQQAAETEAFRLWRGEQAEKDRLWREQRAAEDRLWREQQAAEEALFRKEMKEYQIANIYARELNCNRTYAYQEDVRHYYDYRAGLPYAEKTAPIDYSTMPTYTPGMPHQPYPQSYHSDWLPMQPNMAPPAGEGPSQTPQPCPHDAHSIYLRVMESIFGPRAGSL